MRHARPAPFPHTPASPILTSSPCTRIPQHPAEHAAMSTPTRPSQPTPEHAEQPTPEPGNTAPTGAHPAPTAPPAVEELSGTFGRYTIVRRLGKGGMGRVYLARDNELGRLVALKVPQLEQGDRATVRERFYREARAAASLHHPHVCPVYDVGCVGEVPYLTMAYVDGQALHEWVQTADVTLADVVALVCK